MPYCVNSVRSIHVIYTDLFCFQASTALCIYVIYANSWINTARPNIVWIQSGNPWAVRRRQTERGMALSAIEGVSQWGVVGCSGSRTKSLTISEQKLKGKNISLLLQTFLNCHIKLCIFKDTYTTHFQAMMIAVLNDLFPTGRVMIDLQ